MLFAYLGQHRFLLYPSLVEDGAAVRYRDIRGGYVSKKGWHMRNILLSTTAVAAILAATPLASTPAYADQITHTYTASRNGDGGFNMPLDLFNSWSGVLSSVIVVETLTTSFVNNPASVYWNTGGYTMTNNGAVNPSIATFDPTATTTLSASGGPSSLDSPPVLVVTAGGPTTFHGRAPWTFSASSVPLSVTVPTPDLTQFEAVGGGISTLTMNVLTVPSGEAGSGGSLTMTWPEGSPVTNFSLQVTYNYVPEPASILVLGVGLVGLGGIYRRKRSRPPNPG